MTRRTTAVAVALLLTVGAVRAAGAQVMDRERYLFALLELLEYRLDAGTRPAAWELVGWYGANVNRLWFKSEGSMATTEQTGDGEVQLLYGRLILPFWDFQVGLRAEGFMDMGGDTRGRMLAVVGLQGFAPGRFDVDSGMYVSQDGDVSARITTAHNLYFTQRVVGESRMELNAAVQDVPELGIGSGLNVLDLGFRLRYEIRREFAPYIGVSWERSLFETADLARARGEPVGELAAVAGIRAWY